MQSKDARLIECLRLLEETGDIERCRGLYPDLGEALSEHASTANGLVALIPPTSSAQSQSSSRRQLLSSLSTMPGGTPLWQRILTKKAAFLAAAAAIFVVGVAGASAATGTSLPQPVNQVLGTLGLASYHSQDVQQKVQDAIDSTEPGPERGRAVSQAACDAAQNRDNLPEGAMDAPGQDDKDTKDCSEIGENSGQGGAVEPSSQGESSSHRQDGQQKGQNGIQSTDPGPERGPVVSETACDAAQNGDNLPERAKNAPGRSDKDTKDCTHPSPEGSSGPENTP